MERRRKWQRIWIAIDDANEESVGRLRELISGLMGGGGDENAVPGELRRLRWLFLGHVPDFLGELTSEALDQMTISTNSDDVKICLLNFAERYNRKADDYVILGSQFFVETRILSPEYTAAYNDPMTRLKTLQDVIAELRPQFLNLLRAR
jgi:hypothetical protein